ncbi:MAG: tRNA epoxyqueuosine(34) reductase QueG [Bryobacteraceae bacterium]
MAGVSHDRFSGVPIRRLARECGFELAGVAAAEPVLETARYREWVAQGFAGEMRYLIDRRAAVRNDPRNILPSANSIICVGKLYNGPEPYSTQFDEPGRAWISRYAWGEDYHEVLRRGLERLVEKLREHADFEYRICVDTAPLLERSYARLAGLGWIGKNTCLIHEGMGSWFFLGELLVSLAIEPDQPAPDRCGTCTRCIDACPTDAIVPFEGAHAVDSRRCISYFTIELRGAHATIPEESRRGIGNHVFGCDICQDACPWNRRAPITGGAAFAPAHFAPPLERLAALTEPEFSEMFANSPVARPRYRGFLRNVAIAMGNEKNERFREPLLKLGASEDAVVAEHARWALHQLESK